MYTFCIFLHVKPLDCYLSKEEEVEKKFADGMLTKMSKITDLISKLDSFANGEDKSRVKKPYA